MIIWSTLSLFGLWIVHRTLIECENLQIFSHEQMLRIRMFSFLTVVLLNFFLRSYSFLLFFVALIIFLSPWWVPYLIARHREKLLKQQFIPLLDHLILSMKTGRGFRTALAMCVERNPKAIQYALREFLSALQYQKEIREPTSDTKIRFFFSELAEVDLSQHKPIDRLKALRRRLMIEKNFRQKSRQALLQVRFQSWIMTAMYMAMLLYVQYEFGLRQYFGLVLFSAIFFVSGLIFVQSMGRKYQWKV